MGPCAPELRQCGFPHRGRIASVVLAAVAVAAFVSGAYTARIDRSATSGTQTPVVETTGMQLSARLVEAFGLLERAVDSGIDRDAAMTLRFEAALARQAARGGELAQARALLDAFDDTLQHVRKNREVGDQKVAEILAALGDVEDALAASIGRG